MDGHRRSRRFYLKALRPRVNSTAREMAGVATSGPVLMQLVSFFFFQAEDGIRDLTVTGVQTCALPISCIHQALQHLAGHAKSKIALHPGRDGAGEDALGSIAWRYQGGTNEGWLSARIRRRAFAAGSE